MKQNKAKQTKQNEITLKKSMHGHFMFWFSYKVGEMPLEIIM